LVIAAACGPERFGWVEKLGFAGAVARRQVREECDVLFFDHLGLARVQGFVPRSHRRPYGVFLHSFEAWTPLSSGRHRALINAKLRIANSHHTAARVTAAHPEVGKIDVCHLALGPEMSGDNDAAVDRSLLEQIRPASALIVGRMSKGERYKGHEQLIQAWPIVKRQLGDAQLVIVGEGDDAPRLQGLARRHGVAEAVLFTGRVNDETLKALYRRTAVFAMPSRAEGFGLVYLEAMLYRLPCIGSTHDAAGEIIVDGETGFLVDQSDIPSLAEKITRLLGDSELRARLGGAGFERLHHQFSFERFQNRIAELFNKLAA
jgi:glycosyltransferase involved in cell wall biosynthesis